MSINNSYINVYTCIYIYTACIQCMYIYNIQYSWMLLFPSTWKNMIGFDPSNPIKLRN